MHQTGSALSAFQVYIGTLDKYEVVDACVYEVVHTKESVPTDRSGKVEEA